MAEEHRPIGTGELADIVHGPKGTESARQNLAKTLARETLLGLNLQLDSAYSKNDFDTAITIESNIGSVLDVHPDLRGEEDWRVIPDLQGDDSSTINNSEQKNYFGNAKKPDIANFAPESDDFWGEEAAPKSLPGKLGEATFWNWQ